jgi:hypothetical protein
MLIKRKINIKRYALFGGLTTSVSAFLCRTNVEIYVLLFVTLAAMLNQYMLLVVTNEMVMSAKESLPRDKNKLLILSGGKIFVIIFSLAVGSHFIGNRIIIPLMNYVCMIFVLSVSFKGEPDS